MATNTTSLISSLSPIKFDPQLAKQFNSQAATLAFLAAKGRVKQGQGLNCDWGIIADGPASASFSPGTAAAFPAANNSTRSPASLARAGYQVDVAVDHYAQSVSLSSGSPIGDPLVDELNSAMAKLGAAVNADLFSHASFGLTLALGTANYAGVDRSTITAFRGNSISSAATLTLDHMAAMDGYIRTQSGLRPDMIVVNPTDFNRYEKLIRAQQGSGVIYNSSPAWDGGAEMLSFRGIPVGQDKDAPAGSMYFLNSSVIEVNYISSLASAVMAFSTLSNDAGGTGLVVEVKQKATNAHAAEMNLSCVLALKVLRPNACGVISGISG